MVLISYEFYTMFCIQIEKFRIERDNIKSILSKLKEGKFQENKLMMVCSMNFVKTPKNEVYKTLERRKINLLTR